MLLIRVGKHVKACPVIDSETTFIQSQMIRVYICY
jgi:hypothetical protein